MFMRVLAAIVASTYRNETDFCARCLYDPGKSHCCLSEEVTSGWKASRRGSHLEAGAGETFPREGAWLEMASVSRPALDLRELKAVGKTLWEKLFDRRALEGITSTDTLGDQSGSAFF